MRTLTSEPIEMPRVPDHQIRIVGIHATGTDYLGLDEVGVALVDRPPA